MNALTASPTVAHHSRPQAQVSFGAVIAATVVVIAVVDTIGGPVGGVGWRYRRDARRASGSEWVGRS